MSSSLRSPFSGQRRRCHVSAPAVVAVSGWGAAAWLSPGHGHRAEGPWSAAGGCGDRGIDGRVPVAVTVVVSMAAGMLTFRVVRALLALPPATIEAERRRAVRCLGRHWGGATGAWLAAVTTSMQPRPGHETSRGRDRDVRSGLPRRRGRPPSPGKDASVLSLATYADASVPKKPASGRVGERPRSQVRSPLVGWVAAVAVSVSPSASVSSVSTPKPRGEGPALDGRVGVGDTVGAASGPAAVLTGRSAPREP